MTKEEIWQSVLNEMELNISKANFATWFKETSIFAIQKNLVTISVPSAFAKEWLTDKYHNTIIKILKRYFPNIKGIDYIIQQTKTAASSPELDKKILLGRQLQLPELKIDKKTNLNPKYTFENFIVGSFNEIAHAAAMSIISRPGQIYNPLFVYGGVGIGKTHLLQAIGNTLNQKFPTLEIKYIQSEKFSQELVQAIRNKTMESFKEKYRRLDVLIMDDVQFIAGKDKTQEELFHTFNTLYDKDKQIIFSSDRPPKAIAMIEERLRSRFEGGMIADIGYPDFETRVAILKTKAQDKGIELSEEVINWIATRIQKNIRELEGALNKIAVSNHLNGSVLSIKDIQKILKDYIASPQKITTPKKIINTVADFYDLKAEDLLNKARKKEFVKPRQIAMYLLRTELSLSFPSIGDKFNHRDHTTAIHAFEKIKKELEGNESLNEEINLLKQIIYSS